MDRFLKLLFFAYTLLIFFLSIYPVKEMPSDDKLVHFLVFFLFTVVMKLSFNIGYWSTFFYGSLYGLFIEAVQYFLPYRSGEYGDFLADCFGVLSGLFTYFLFEFLYMELKYKE